MVTITGASPDAASMAASQWARFQPSVPSSEVTVLPPALSARTDKNTAQQALGRPLPVVIGTGRVDGVYFVGGIETVSTVTTTEDEPPPSPLEGQSIVVVGAPPNAASEAASQWTYFANKRTTTFTSTTETENRTMAGYVLAYDEFERGYDLVRLEVDGNVVYDVEAGIPAATTFRFYGGRHSSTDEILTEMIGANAGAYKNFVMVFIDGYPSDSPPGVSAVISNAAPTLTASLFIDFVNHYAELNSTEVPWASLSTIFTGGTIDAGGWYGGGLLAGGNGSIVGEALSVFTNDAGITIVEEYSTVQTYNLSGQRVQFNTNGINDFFAYPKYISVELQGVELQDQTGPDVIYVGSDVAGISRLAVSVDNTHFHGSQNGSAVVSGNLGSPPPFSTDSATSQVTFFTANNTGTLAEGARLRSIRVGPFTAPAGLPALSTVGFSSLSTIGWSPQLLALKDVCTDVMSLAGFGPADLTFYGFDIVQSYGFVIASDTTIQNAVRSLSDIYGFAWCDTGSGFIFKKPATGDSLTVNAEFTASDIVERPQPVMSSDDADIRTPSSVEMEYVSKEGDYKSRPASFNMTTGVLNSITTPRLSTPILLNDAEAQRIVTEKFFEYQEKRRDHSLVVAPENIVLLPGDIVSIPSGATTYITRVEGVGIDLRNMGVEISARDFQTEVATEITSVKNNGPVWHVVQFASEYVHLDMPLLRYADDTDGASLVQYGALMPKGQDLWSGATLYRSPLTTGYAAIFDQLSHAGVRGICQTVLPAPADPFALDDGSTLTISRTTAATSLLADATEAEVLAGANNALVGTNGRWEWVGYKTVIDHGDGTYTLGGFTLRGYRGSEVFCGTHAIGDVFIMIDPGWVRKMLHPLAALDATFYYKAPGLGQNLSAVTATTHTIPGTAETPYAPTSLKADTSGSGGIDITWDYRSRIATGFNPVEHGEATLAFQVDIYDTDGTTYIRTLTTATNSVHYAAADVIADFGSDPPSECFFRVYMMSALPILVAGQDRPVAGRGYEARGHFPTVMLLLSGDMQSGTDHVKLSGDAAPGNLLLTEE